MRLPEEMPNAISFGEIPGFRRLSGALNNAL